MGKNFLLLLFFLSGVNGCLAEVPSQPFHLHEHEQWWQEYAGTFNFWPKLELWQQDIHKPSRKKMREYVAQAHYKSILDIPCGAGTDYVGIMHDALEIEYQGVEITPKLVDFCKGYNIPAMLGSIENIPFDDAHFDIAYARHVLEHLSYYEVALKELIRVAKKEVLVVFFIPPRPLLPDKINLYVVRGLPLYNNWYNKELIEQFIMKQKKIYSFSWQKISSSECFLHIYLNEKLIKN